MTPTRDEREAGILLIVESCLSVTDACDVARAWLPDLTTQQRMAHIAGLRGLVNRIRLLRQAKVHPDVYSQRRHGESGLAHRERETATQRELLTVSIRTAVLTDEQAPSGPVRERAYDALTGQGYTDGQAAAIAGRLGVTS